MNHYALNVAKCVGFSESIQMVGVFGCATIVISITHLLIYIPLRKIPDGKEIK